MIPTIVKHETFMDGIYPDMVHPHWNVWRFVTDQMSRTEPTLSMQEQLPLPVEADGFKTVSNRKKNNRSSF